jgi:hypothetical protein
MCNIIKKIEKYLTDNNTDKELTALLHEAKKRINQNPEPQITTDPIHTKLAYFNITDTFSEQAKKTGFRAHHTGIMLHKFNTQQEELKTCIQLTALSLDLTSKSAKEDERNLHIPSPLRDFLMELGPWMQSFANSHTIRNSCPEIEPFDLEIFEKAPTIKLKYDTTN